MLPIIGLATLAIVMSLKGFLGMILSLGVIGWSTAAATRSSYFASCLTHTLTEYLILASISQNSFGWWPTPPCYFTAASFSLQSFNPNQTYQMPPRLREIAQHKPIGKKEQEKT
jgi:hypothetical protein